VAAGLADSREHTAREVFEISPARMPGGDSCTLEDAQTGPPPPTCLHSPEFRPGRAASSLAGMRLFFLAKTDQPFSVLHLSLYGSDFDILGR